MNAPADLTLNEASGATGATVLADLQNAMANNAAIQAAGIKLTTSTTGSPLVFTAKKGEQFQVPASGDASNTLGLGSLSGSTGATTFDVSTVTGGTTTFASGVENLAISIGGAAASSFSVTTATTTTQGALDALNAVFTTNATFQAAGLKLSPPRGPSPSPPPTERPSASPTSPTPIPGDSDPRKLPVMPSPRKAPSRPRPPWTPAVPTKPT